MLLELVREVGIEPKWVASTQGGEYHSPCPACGGNDRFFIQPNKNMSKCVGSYCCRQCGKKGDSIQFCIDFLGLSFKSATERLGVDLAERSSLYPFRFALRKMKEFSPLTVQEPSERWKEKAFVFVMWAHQHLLQQPAILKRLENRGIPYEAVVRYKIGWCPKNFTRGAVEWGGDARDKAIWLPKGIVVPTFDRQSVVRLKIRRADYHDGEKLPKYVIVSGGMNGLSIIGDLKHPVMVAVESELDAYAIQHAAGDLVCVVAVGSNMKNPDNVTDCYAKNCSSLLICYDNDDPGKKMFDKWKHIYSHAKECPTPMGKDVGEAVAMGLDLRAWLLEVLGKQK